MDRPMINATLFNVPSEDDEYMELRQQMVDELVTDQMASPLSTLMAMLEEGLLNEFGGYDDDVLQDMYDNLKEDKKEPKMNATMMDEIRYPRDKETETERNVRKMVESGEEDTNE